MSEFTDKLRYCSEYHDDFTAVITDEAADMIERMEKEISAMVSAFSHMHVNNGEDDYCAECGLYLTHPVHIRIK